MVRSSECAAAWEPWWERCDVEFAPLPYSRSRNVHEADEAPCCFLRNLPHLLNARSMRTVGPAPLPPRNSAIDEWPIRNRVARGSTLHRALRAGGTPYAPMQDTLWLRNAAASPCTALSARQCKHRTFECVEYVLQQLGLGNATAASLDLMYSNSTWTWPILW